MLFHVWLFLEQPPLQFYMHVLQEQPWDRVDVVTNANHAEALNPVVTALAAKVELGELPDIVHIHTVGQPETHPNDTHLISLRPRQRKGEHPSMYSSRKYCPRRYFA